MYFQYPKKSDTLFIAKADFKEYIDWHTKLVGIIGMDRPPVTTKKNIYNENGSGKGAPLSTLVVLCVGNF